MLFKENLYIWYEKLKFVILFVFDVIFKNVIFGKLFYVDGFKKFVELFIKKWNRDDIIDYKFEKLELDYFIKLSFLKLMRNM